MNNDRESVWARVRAEEPTFLEQYDPTNNYHTVREIVLGGSLTWAETNRRFRPKPGTRVMDIGANVGIYSAWCAANGATVVAYEADSKSFVYLKDIALPFERHNVAIMPYHGEVKFLGHSKWDSGDDCEWHNGGTEVPGIKIMPDDPSVIVPCITFEEALRNTRWDMVKMDIEGGEAELLLETPEKALKQIGFMYVELHPWTPQDLHDRVIARMQSIYKFSGHWSAALNRWEALYLEAK